MKSLKYPPRRENEKSKNPPDVATLVILMDGAWHITSKSNSSARTTADTDRENVQRSWGGLRHRRQRLHRLLAGPSPSRTPLHCSRHCQKSQLLPRPSIQNPLLLIINWLMISNTSNFIFTENLKIVSCFVNYRWWKRNSSSQSARRSWHASPSLPNRPPRLRRHRRRGHRLYWCLPLGLTLHCRQSRRSSEPAFESRG